MTNNEYLLWRFCKFCTVGKAVPGVRVKVVREETNSWGELVGELLGYGRNLCMGYLNKVSLHIFFHSCIH